VPDLASTEDSRRGLDRVELGIVRRDNVGGLNRCGCCGVDYVSGADQEYTERSDDGDDPGACAHATERVAEKMAGGRIAPAPFIVKGASAVRKEKQS